jgi:hypothetical protein
MESTHQSSEGVQAKLQSAVPLGLGVHGFLRTKRTASHAVLALLLAILRGKGRPSLGVLTALVCGVPPSGAEIPVVALH